VVIDDLIQKMKVQLPRDIYNRINTYLLQEVIRGKLKAPARGQG
jgi:hypothetical protein